ncbi:MAG: RagB/SusD family nutrient uptake outer membrane protein, partial [Alistipes sp.]|nr:RagB/SusD family nutrient uptake outer membrane protein [Alistipes sp.]
YEEGDIRRDGSILNWEKYVKESNPNASYDARWQDTGYFLLKYAGRVNYNHGYLGDPNMNHGNNVRVYRYAETLLNAAELSVLLGQDGSPYLKEVRDRAHCTATGVSRNDIIEERHKEFVGEGKRYWDLVRSGLATTELTAARHEYRQTDWSESKKYWPIPQSEVDKDPGIKQNAY